MKKDELLKLGLDEEMAEKVANASQEELRGYIPKARFDEVNNEKKNLETSLKERDTQLENLKNSSSDIEAMKKEIETLQSDNKKKDEAHAAEIKKLKIDTAVSLALSNAKAKNEKAVKALLDIDLEKAEFTEEGQLKGLDEQIKNLVKGEDTKFLFEEGSKEVKFKGAVPGSSTKVDKSDEIDISKMTYSELAAYMAENPDVKID